MPRKKSATSLRLICFVNMAKNIDKVWGQDFFKWFSDTPRLLYVIGPFDHMTSEMIQEFVNVLVQQKVLRRQHFQLLIHSRIKELDLSVAKMAANQDSVINLLGTRCQKLIKLNISGCNQVSVRTLVNLVNSLPGLKSLNLRLTKCNDQVLAALGTKCPELLELDVFGCRAVTDTGAFNLCDDIAGHTPRCSKLIKLDVAGTMVGEDGATFLLRSLKQLQFLGFADLCGIFEKLHADSFPLNCTGVPVKAQYQLRSLTSSQIKCQALTAQSVEIACLYCPLVTEVYLYVNVQNRSVQHLGTLPNLRVLEIANSDMELLTFEGGIQPLLEKIGNQLLSLALYEFSDIDVNVIGAHCSSLQKLCLVLTVMPHPNFLSTPLPLTLRKTIFSDLRLLKLILESETASFPSDTLECILNNARKLQDILLVKVQSLTTELLSRALQEHSFQSLKTLTLKSCHHINDLAISKLLGCDNCLSTVELECCQEITRQDFDRFKHFIRFNNLDLSITWE